jgi:hypothetical protein
MISWLNLQQNTPNFHGATSATVLGTPPVVEFVTIADHQDESAWC